MDNSNKMIDFDEISIGEWHEFIDSESLLRLGLHFLNKKTF
jgi:hypothetical protein